MKNVVKTSVKGIAALVLPLTVLANETPVKVGGFVDTQMNIGLGDAQTYGFTLNDGAVYLSKELSGSKVMVDLPFRLASGTPNGGGSPNFELGIVRGQAYVEHKYANGFRWKLGQFDTSYGFEVNDTVDVAFTSQGIIYNNTDPFVHMGMQLGYDFTDKLGMNILVGAGPQDSGFMAKNEKPSFGLQFVSTADFRWSLGTIMDMVTAVSDNKSALDMYFDVTLGKNLGNLAVDLEFNYKMAKSIQVGAADAMADQKRMGILANIMYSFNETLSAGTRIEYASQMNASTDKNLRVIVGPQMQMTPAMKVKFDYTLDQVTPYGAGATATTQHVLNLAAVFRM